ncbi:hypothetical protein BH24ACT19_BH24ACT19_16980 [soil metagenome]
MPWLRPSARLLGAGNLPSGRTAFTVSSGEDEQAVSWVSLVELLDGETSPE